MSSYPLSRGDLGGDIGTSAFSSLWAERNTTPATTTIMSLESLPNEVLLQIAQWLALQIEWPYCNARSLSRLARCSKRLGSIATPLIYSTFVSTGSEALPRLLGRVLSRPKVGRRIKEYNMDLSSAEDIDYKRAKKMAYQHVGVDSIAVKDQIVSAVKITGIQHCKLTFRIIYMFRDVRITLLPFITRDPCYCAWRLLKLQCFISV